MAIGGTVDGGLDLAAVEAVRRHCTSAGYTVDGVTELLGEVASLALLRDDLLPSRRAVAGDDTPLGRLVRLFLLGETVPAGPDLAPLDALGLTRGGRALLDLRPVDDDLVVSDLGSEVTGAPVLPHHVLGVGGASTTLAQATPRAPVGRALDLGTGCGIQALQLARHADSVVATDTSARALRLARLTLALAGLDSRGGGGGTVELRAGDLLDPVAGETFDLVVSNPPFVVGPPGRASFSYRDSGRGGDALTAELLRAAPAHLAPGGTAVLLGNWVHRRGHDWRERVGDWLAGGGCDAWVAQREVSDPAEYVALWLRDTGNDPAHQQQAYGAWLDWFEDAGAQGVGFGVVALRRCDAADPSVTLEDVREPTAAVTGADLAARLDRQGWLRAHDDAALSAARLVPAAGLTLTQAAGLGDGWEVGTQLLIHGGRSTPTDAVGVALLQGCHAAGGRPVGALLAVLGAVHGFAPADGLTAVRHLVERGVLEPAESGG